MTRACACAAGVVALPYRLMGQLGHDGGLGGQGEVGRQAGVGGRQLAPSDGSGRIEPGGDGVAGARGAGGGRARTPSCSIAFAPARPCTARVAGGAGRSRLTKSVIVTRAAEGLLPGRATGARRGRERPRSPRRIPVSAALTPAVGTHSVPLKEESVPTCQ